MLQGFVLIPCSDVIFIRHCKKGRLLKGKIIFLSINMTDMWLICHGTFLAPSHHFGTFGINNDLYTCVFVFSGND